MEEGAEYEEQEEATTSTSTLTPMEAAEEKQSTQLKDIFTQISTLLTHTVGIMKNPYPLPSETQTPYPKKEEEGDNHHHHHHHHHHSHEEDNPEFPDPAHIAQTEILDVSEREEDHEWTRAERLKVVYEAKHQGVERVAIKYGINSGTVDIWVNLHKGGSTSRGNLGDFIAGGKDKAIGIPGAAGGIKRGGPTRINRDIEEALHEWWVLYIYILYTLGT